MATCRSIACRALAFFALIAVSLAALLSTGCANGGHGKYVSQNIAEAQQKMSMLKSGTEWQMAHQQFLAGDLNKALKTVDRSIALNGNVPKSHVLRGRIMLEKSRLEEARQEFLAAEKLDPSFVDAQYYLGIVHERVNEPEEALNRYRRAMELDPANPQYVVAAAEMLITQSRLDDAENLLTARKQFMEYNAAVRQTLGHIALLRSQPQVAVNCFHEALLLAPGDQSIGEDLIQAEMACSQFAEAESSLAKMLDNDALKGRRDLKYMRSKCLTTLNRPVEARAVLQDLTSDRDGAADLRAWIDLGNVAAILHDKATLRASMNKVAAIAPSRPEGPMLKAMYYRQENRLDDALASCDQAIANIGTSHDASPFVLKAIILQDLGRVADARETLAIAQQVDPRNMQSQALLRSIDNATAGHPDAP